MKFIEEKELDDKLKKLEEIKDHPHKWYIIMKELQTKNIWTKNI